MDRREFLVAAGALIAASAIPGSVKAELITPADTIEIPVGSLYYLIDEHPEGEHGERMIGDRVVVHMPVKLPAFGFDKKRWVIIRKQERFIIETCKNEVTYTLIPEELLNG